VRVPGLVLSLVLGLVVAGCVTPGSNQKTASVPDAYAATQWAEKALGKLDAKHDHNDPAQHRNLSTPDLVEDGYDPLQLKAGHSAGGYYCGETANSTQGRRLAVVTGFTGEVAFVLSDVTDPAHPVELAEYHLDSDLAYEHVYDVAMTRDAKHVLVSVNPTPTGLPPILGAALVREDRADVRREVRAAHVRLEPRAQRPARGAARVPDVDRAAAELR
jgi:hypothetical protein